VTNSDLNRDLSRALRDVMTERDITQMQVAAALGRSQSYVSTRTSGRIDLSTDIIAAVASLAHLSPRALMVELTERMIQH
jgi:transcriptional regulator with XRE-family HTH domain